MTSKQLWKLERKKTPIHIFCFLEGILMTHNCRVKKVTACLMWWHHLQILFLRILFKTCSTVINSLKCKMGGSSLLFVGSHNDILSSTALSRLLLMLLSNVNIFEKIFLWEAKKRTHRSWLRVCNPLKSPNKKDYHTFQSIFHHNFFFSYRRELIMLQMWHFEFKCPQNRRLSGPKHCGGVRTRWSLRCLQKIVQKRIRWKGLLFISQIVFPFT